MNDEERAQFRIQLQSKNVAGGFFLGFFFGGLGMLYASVALGLAFIGLEAVVWIVSIHALATSNDPSLGMVFAISSFYHIACGLISMWHIKALNEKAIQEVRGGITKQLV